MSTQTSIIGAALFLGASTVAQAITFDFETPGQFTANFRNLAGTTAAQSSNGAANDFISHSTGTGRSYVFDTTPASAAVKDTFTVGGATRMELSADVRMTAAGSSFGFHIINPANEAQAYLALLNVDVGGPNEQFRFSSGADPTTVGAGTLVNGSFANNADAGISVGNFFNVKLLYSVNALNQPVFALTAGNVTSTHTFAVAAFPSFEVGIRSFTAGSLTSAVNEIDNISINLITIPEPGTVGLMGLAMSGLLSVRRRREQV